MLNDAPGGTPIELRSANLIPRGQRAPGGDRLSVNARDLSDDDDVEDEPLDRRADRREPDFGANSEGFEYLDADASPWAPLIGMLDSTEAEASPDGRPSSPPAEVEKAHSLELRAESMLQYAERGAARTGKLDCTEVGLSDDNRDVVAGRDEAEVAEMLRENTGHSLVHLADNVEIEIGGSLDVHANLEDNLIMAGVMTDEFKGGVFVTAAMSDDLVAGAGLRCTAPLDLGVHGLMGMEERPGTAMADGVLLDVAGTLYDREYGPSMYRTLVARHTGTTITTMRSGFFPLMKVALGARNLVPGGAGGGGNANASPPAAPPAGGAGGAAGTAGAATLTAAASGGALGRGVASGSDTDEIVSAARTAQRASDVADVEDLRHPATTADNLDDLSRVDVEGGGYRQIGEIYGESVPSGGWIETEDGSIYPITHSSDPAHATRTEDGAGAHRLADSDPGPAAPLSSESANPGVNQVDGASAPATDVPTPLPSRQPPADTTPPVAAAAPDSVFVTPYPKPLDVAEPGTEEYDFGKTYASLRDRLQHYRDFTNWRGNLATEEALRAIDKKAVELFTSVGGSIDDLPVDSSARTTAIRNAMQDMAAAPGDGRNLEKIRGAIDELDAFTHNTVVVMASRADEFSGAAIGSQRAPIDPGVDTVKLRSWLQEQMLKARARAAEPGNFLDSDAAAKAQTLAILEEQYYYQLTKALDKGVNPLYVSNDLISLTHADLEDLYRQSAPNVAARRPMKADELNLLLNLQGNLVATLSDPDYIRPVGVAGADTIASGSRRRIQWALDLAESNELRRAAHGENPPPLPAPSHSNKVGNVGDVRDRHFSRSALEAGAETLERRVLSLSDQDAPDLNRMVSAGTDSGIESTPMPSPSSHRPSPDTAPAPIVDERTGVWATHSPVGAEVSPTPSSSTSASTQVDGPSSQTSALSWDSGLRESGGPEVRPAAGEADNASPSELFRATAGHGHGEVGDTFHAGNSSTDGLSGSPADAGPRRVPSTASQWGTGVGTWTP